MKLIDISEIPNFEITCSNGKQYVLLPFEHLSDIPVVDGVLTKEQIHIVLRDFATLVLKEEPSQARYEKTCLLQDLDRAFREA
jgi:hypothetical protein